MKKIFKQSLWIAGIGLFLFSYQNTVGQSLTVSGKVTDETNQALPGATIMVKGTSIGTTSNSVGEYTIKSPGMEDTLIFSFIGYENQEVPINKATTINVQLKASARSMNQVVVVAVGNKQTKRSITGAIATIKTKELKQSPVANLSNALAGRLPGLITVQSSGEPGNDAATMYIRGIGTYGNTTPLVVIDGLPRSLADLNHLDPSVIESVSILKDAASTALYGIQGANGVIVVTTKRGGANQVPLLNFTAQQAIQQPIRLPKMMNTYEQAKFYKELDQNNGQPQRYTDQVMQIIKDGSKPYLYPDVNWYHALLKNVAPQNQYNLNISGSMNNIRYFLSGSYIGQGTLLKYGNIFEKNYGIKTKYDRYNFRSNIDLDATRMLHIRIDLAGRLGNQVGPSNGFSNLFQEMTDRSPAAEPMFNPNGTLGAGSALNIPYHQNLYGMITQGGYYTKYTNDMYGTLSAKHDLDFITKGLNVQVYFSFESQSVKNTIRSQDFDSYWYKGVGNNGDSIYQQVGIHSRLTTSGNSFIERNHYLDFRINYNRIFDDHTVTAQIRADRSLKRINDALPYAYQGLSGHFTYNYKSKYYASVNIGYNGSENFPKNRRYGFFPAFSAAWVLSDESFITNNINWIKFLKLRASYGLVGNDKIGGDRWLYISDFAPGGSYTFGVSPSSVPGYNENRVGNKYVTWERAAKSNIGIDMSLFKNDVVQLTFNLFRERRRNILTAPGTIPDFVGITNLAPRNTGEVLNHGFDGEIRLNWELGDLQMFTNLQLTYAKNKVIKNDQPIPQFPYQDLRGHSVGYVLGYEADGLFQNKEEIDKSANQTFSGEVIPGDIKYVDVNHDGIIDPSDRIPIQLFNVPNYVGGLSIGGNYKALDFSLLFNGALGGTSNVHLYDGSLLWLQRWTEDNPNTKIPIAHSTLNNSITSTFFIQKTDYLKLRNAEIGYRIPKKLLNHVKIKSARIYINGQNLLILDKLWLKDRDPESSGNTYFINYPILRIINIGIHVQF